jgi:ribosomal protein L7/L12
MKCSEIEERLTAYLENFLQNEERGAIEEHCARCASCRGALEDLKRTREILGRLDEVEPPAWLEEKVMARIAGKEKREGWLQRFFLPLHVKVPVQALAMALVVVISVYLYKSTTPEPGDLARLQAPPQASESRDAAAKKEADTKKKIEQASRPDTPGKERKKAEVRKAPAQSMPSVPEKMPAAPKGGTSVNEADASRTPPIVARGDSIGQAVMKEAPVAAAPHPEKTERFKTRGAAPMAARGEKKAEYTTAAPEIPRETPWQIIVTSADPSDAVHKARRILISLSVKEVRERTEGGSIIISGRIDPKRVSELKNRMAEIAVVHAVRTGTGGTVSEPVEIIVLKDPVSP